MITLTRINKTSLAINADLIKFVESAPDTVITLSTGEKVVVTESLERIIELIIQFRRQILTGIPCPAAGLYLAALGATRNTPPRVDGQVAPERGM